MIIQFFKSLYLQKRFFYIAIAIVVLFVLAFIYPVLLIIGKIALIGLAALVLIDIFVLYFVLYFNSKKKSIKK